MRRIEIAPEDPHSLDASIMLQELSQCLQAITGDSGEGSFHMDDVCGPRSIFILARNEKGLPVGCGALRPLEGSIAEIKRMYAQEKSSGLGRQMLCYLEKQAVAMEYDTIWLETRKINQKAVDFYLKNGYQIIPNFGRYIGRPEAVCFEKKLIAIRNEK